MIQILEQHIRNVLPTLKTELTSHLVAVEKELSAYGEALESKVKTICYDVILNPLCGKWFFMNYNVQHRKND